MAESASATAPGPAFTAPAHCPSYPADLGATNAQASAVIVAILGARISPTQIHSLARNTQLGRAGSLRAHANRGPPAAEIA